MTKRLILPLALLAGLQWAATDARAVTPYAYGNLPSGASDAHVNAAYSTWKARRLVLNSTGCTNASSVNNGGGNAYSEGVAYGMLMAAYLEPDDTQLLKFWNFYWGNRNSRNVMNWNVGINACSNNNANGAADADLDVATALIRASRRWPASANNWATKAQTVLDNMYTHYRDSCNGLKNGDAWGGCSPSTSNDGYNPSYMRTGYMRSYDCFEGGSRWDAMRTRSYNVMNHAYVNYALPPDWVHSHAGSLGQFGRATNSGGYGYDSCRTPWSVTQDYLWWNNTTGRNWANKIAGVFKTKGGGTPLGAANDVGDDYNYNTGAKVSNNHNNEFIGGAAISFMADSSNSAFLNEFYNELVAEDDNSYYSDSLKVIYLMILTGIFQEPCNGAGPAGTATPTFTRTPSFTPSPTPTPAFGLSKTASAASASVGVPFTYYIDYYNLSSGPDTVGVRAGVSLEFHNSNAGASGSRSNVNYRINNASGSSISLSNYRIRYYHYDATKTSVGDYASYEYNDASGQGTGSILVYSPAYTGGPDMANMEQRIVFAGGTVNNGNTVVWEGALGSNADSWTMNHADDWSYPGSVGSYSAANGQNVVLEENVGGTWKLASGAYPGGSAGIANVTISDVLDSRIDYVSALPAGGTYSGGSRTYSITLPSLPAGGYGRISITAQFNGTAAVGNVVPNSALIAASGYPNTASNVRNVTVAGAANTATFTSTRTRTATPANSATSSSTPTPTRSSTATSTQSPQNTSTSTHTRTATRSATPSVSQTFSSTSSLTPGNSPTDTSTSTVTPTRTPTRTRTATPSISQTFSSTSSITPGNSPTFTATHTVTPVNTSTSSATATPSISVTFSSTRSITPGNSPTFTATGTVTPVNTATSSATATPSISVTFSSTSSITPGNSPTFTASRTVTPVDTVTASATETALIASSHTSTATPSSTLTPTPTSTQTGLPTPVPPVPTATDTPMSGGPNEIESHAAYPNPWNGQGPGYVAVKLAGRADKVTLTFYTKAMVALGTREIGPRNGGWCQVPLPDEMHSVASGTYYYVVGSERGGEKNLKKQVGRLVVLR